MLIKEMLSRHRNDFTFICACEHCGHEFKRGDGYADHYFCKVVVPNQHCPKCGWNSFGETKAETEAHCAAAEDERRQAKPAHGV